METTWNPTGLTPLAGQIRLLTTKPTKPTWLEVEGGIDSQLPSDSFQTSHEIPLLGFRPNTRHRYRLHLEAENGREVISNWQTVTTDPLPVDFPKLTLIRDEPGREKGFLFFFASLWSEGQVLPGEGYAIITDRFGQVLWYQHFDALFNEIRFDSDGRMIMLDLINRTLTWNDLLGKTHRAYQAVGRQVAQKTGVPVETDTFHHDFAYDTRRKLWWTLSTRLVGEIVDDLLIGFDGEGQIKAQHSLLDLLQRDRTIYPRVPGLWNSVYHDTFIDWGHANSVFLDQENSNALVSLRHQDSVVSLGLDTGKLNWILGPPEQWRYPYTTYLLTAGPDFQWPRKQHAAKWSRSGTLLLFDNGREHSRVVELKIFPKQKRVEQVWQFTDATPFHSTFLCDVDELYPSGNLQITDGGRKSPEGKFWGRLLEVTHTDPPRTLFELKIETATPRGVSIYRSERLKSLYFRPSGRGESHGS